MLIIVCLPSLCYFNGVLSLFFITFLKPGIVLFSTLQCDGFLDKCVLQIKNCLYTISILFFRNKHCHYILKPDLVIFSTLESDAFLYKYIQRFKELWTYYHFTNLKKCVISLIISNIFRNKIEESMN